ncbi:endoplasmic reticulum resident protein 29 [Trichonephila clavipes]|nr:endoplasmic reticulum resident protein 29 [Trichonephila clavipes]
MSSQHFTIYSCTFWAPEAWGPRIIDTANMAAAMPLKRDVRLVLNKCLPKLDELAEKFMAASKYDERQAILSEANQIASGITSTEEIKYTDVYIKMMQKVLERGDGFIASEKERVKNIKDGKITAAKKEEMQGRLNILQSFIKKDEL